MNSKPVAAEEFTRNVSFHKEGRWYWVVMDGRKVARTTSDMKALELAQELRDNGFIEVSE